MAGHMTVILYLVWQKNCTISSITSPKPFAIKSWFSLTQGFNLSVEIIFTLHHNQCFLMRKLKRLHHHRQCLNETGKWEAWTYSAAAKQYIKCSECLPALNQTRHWSVTWSVSNFMCIRYATNWNLGLERTMSLLHMQQQNYEILWR